MSALERPLAPTAGVLLLIGEALLDLLLLPPRLVLAAFRAEARRGEITRLVCAKDRNAT